MTGAEMLAMYVSEITTHTWDVATATGQHPKLVVFRINYDGQKDVWRSLGVQKQATLIAFHGRRETGRIAFMTDADKIAQLVASTEQ